MNNLISGLDEQLKRNRELLKLYEEIPAGAFGAAMIRKDIEAGEKALADGDVVAMLRAFKALEASK